ncbi:MAG: aldose 1-epimerase [Neisseria sp.]|nr:aldose 1-epimerase [Neisseria sp.]
MTFTVETLKNRIILRETGKQEAEIYLFGALPNRYAKPDANGVWHNIFAAYESPEDAEARITAGFHGAKLSPFACRLKNSRYTFGGQTRTLEKHVLNGHAIHGLLYDAPFELAASGADETGAWAELVYDYAAGYGGYPFAYRLTVRYTLFSDGLSVRTTAQNTGETTLPLADGWHPYFCLGVSVDDYTLQINSREMLEFDEALVPTGKRLPDTRFTEPASLRGVELDNSFVLNGQGTACTLTGGGWKLAIVAVQGYPLLQIYIPPERDRIAIENLSGAPDCFNNGIGLIELAAGESRAFEAVYTFEAV